MDGRRLKICIYGGSEHEGTPIAFVEALTTELLSSLSAVLITGGFLHSEGAPEANTTDAAVVRAANRLAAKQGRDPHDLVEAWMPQPELDDHRKGKRAVRMTEDDGVRIRRLEGTTPLGRRLAMVRDVDAVISVAGRRNTEVVVEQAIELGLPTIPVPGDPDASDKDTSAKLGERHIERLRSKFPDGHYDTAMADIRRDVISAPTRAADRLVRLLANARIGRCLVLMPYDQRHDDLFAREFAPAISPHLDPIRIDRQLPSRSIDGNIREALQHATAAIADITDRNDNVMYEIGLAHGLGLDVLVFTRRRRRIEELPIYLETINVHPLTNRAARTKTIGAFAAWAKLGDRAGALPGFGSGRGSDSLRPR